MMQIAASIFSVFFLISKVLSHHLPNLIFSFILCLLPIDKKERLKMLSIFPTVTELIHSGWRLGFLMLI